VADSGLDGACRFRQALRPTLEVRFLKAVPYRAFRGFQLNIPQIFLAFVVEHDPVFVQCPGVATDLHRQDRSQTIAVACPNGPGHFHCVANLKALKIRSFAVQYRFSLINLVKQIQKLFLGIASAQSGKT
jgi:hypothetical protein